MLSTCICNPPDTHALFYYYLHTSPPTIGHMSYQSVFNNSISITWHGLEPSILFNCNIVLDPFQMKNDCGGYGLIALHVQNVGHASVMKPHSCTQRLLYCVCVSRFLCNHRCCTCDFQTWGIGEASVTSTS